jgi:mono/diheme cytochrome c family protein
MISPIYWALLSGGILTGFGSGFRASVATSRTLSQAFAVDTPPAAPQKPADDQPENAPKVGPTEYEGWRQYSVNCARCHGQDVLPNPVAANLLVSLGSGGPVDTPEKFSQVVSEGRAHRGMPAFKGTLSPDQIQAVYAYVKGRAEKQITPGRPAKPGE